MVGAANSDSARISFLGSTKGELAQKLDGGQDAVGPPAADSSAPRTARNGRLLHGSLTLPGVGVPIIRRRDGKKDSYIDTAVIRNRHLYQNSPKSFLYSKTGVHFD
jgi:hypothetical protein